MNNKLIPIVLTLVVGIILAGSVLMPVLGDATATEKTYKNEGYFNLEKYTDGLTFSWDYANPDVFTVNDEEITFHNDSGLTVSIVLGEKFAIRLTNNNASLSYFGAGQYVNANATYTTLTATLSEGTLTVTNGTTTKTLTSVSEVYAIEPNGSYVMKKDDSVAYLNSGSEIVADSEIYASGQTFNGSNYIFWHMDGTIEDMKYPDEYDSGLTISNEAIHGQYSTVCNDLYELNNITFTATASNSVVYNVTASYFVVPAEVTAELTNHLTPGQIALMGTIPIMVIVALLVVAVGVVARRNE